MDRTSTGSYSAEASFFDRGFVATFSWNLQPLSPKRMSGVMTIMTRPGNVALELLGTGPHKPVMDCECDAIRRKRDEYVQLRELYRGAGGVPSGGGGGQDVDDTVDQELGNQGGVAETEWATHPGTCVIRQGSLETDYPSQPALEVAARSGYEHELVHRTRCCAMYQARTQWDADHPELAQLESKGCGS